MCGHFSWFCVFVPDSCHCDVVVENNEGAMQAAVDYLTLKPHDAVMKGNIKYYESVGMKRKDFEPSEVGEAALKAAALPCVCVCVCVGGGGGGGGGLPCACVCVGGGGGGYLVRVCVWVEGGGGYLVRVCACGWRGGGGALPCACVCVGGGGGGGGHALPYQTKQCGIL